jgi:hypothetical protein
MDSLDRTNVCSFYLVVYLIIIAFNGLMDSPKINEIDVLSQDLKTFLAESFIGIGNFVSMLYTNTPACMTQIFIDFGNLDLKQQEIQLYQ